MADAKTTTKPAESTGSAYDKLPQRVKTADSSEPDIGWTVQAGSRPDELADPNPVTFSKDQLPRPAVMKEQGVPVESYLSHFDNVEGASVDEGVLVDDSGQPLSESLADNDEDAVDETGTTNPVAVSKSAPPAKKKA